MKLHLPVVAACIGCVNLQAQETNQFKSVAEIAPWSSKYEATHPDRVLREKPEPSSIQIGKSDYAITGPLVEGLRRKKASPDLSRGERFLRLPVVRLFVPLPTPPPPGGGKYFRWGQTDRSWVHVASGAAPGIGSDAVRHESQMNLISVSTKPAK